MLHEIDNDEEFLQKIVSSKEAIETFYVCGHVHCHNVQGWVHENPCPYIEYKHVQSWTKKTHHLLLFLHILT